MRTKPLRLLAILLLSIILSPAAAQAQPPVVRAVLFYSPTCGHCHYVMTEVLPPLQEQYGDQLQIATVDASTPEGYALYRTAVEQLAPGVTGVPLLILGETALVGSAEIPEQLPALIEQYLAQGGVDWPAIPGLVIATAVPEAPPPLTAEPTAEATAAAGAIAPTAPPTTAAVVTVASAPALELTTGQETGAGLLSKFRRDLAGNTLSVAVLVAMLAVVAYVVPRSAPVWSSKAQTVAAGEAAGWRAWAVGALCLVGLAVSAYMAYVETTQTAALCGPVGDCNTVQQSAYARLFGRIPIGVLGVAGYLAMLAAWVGTRRGRAPVQRWARRALLAMALAGTLFSIYLTFLEPFVIGATCAWCLTSAVTITLILLLWAGAVAVPRRPASPHEQPA